MDLLRQPLLETNPATITESTTTIEYPASGRKVVVDSKGNIISDTHSSPPRVKNY